MALHKFAKQPSTSTSALYILLQGQAPTWIQQYQQAKHEAAAAAAALHEEEQQQKGAAALQQQNEQQQSQTSTFKIKSRLLNRRSRRVLEVADELGIMAIRRQKSKSTF
jgi:hypothetical protein